jgi:hypothetical protein
MPRTVTTDCKLVEPYWHSVITVPVCWLGDCHWPAGIQPCLLIHWHSNIQLHSCTILRIHLAKIFILILVVFLPLREDWIHLEIRTLVPRTDTLQFCKCRFLFVCAVEENKMSSCLWPISCKGHLFLWWIHGDPGYILLALWTFITCSWVNFTFYNQISDWRKH